MRATLLALIAAVSRWWTTRTSTPRTPTQNSRSSGSRSYPPTPLPWPHPQSTRCPESTSSTSPPYPKRPRNCAGGLADSPIVTTYRYLDNDAIYAEFAAFYDDQPETLDLVEPSQLPTRFDMSTTGLESALQVTVAFESLDAVDQVDSRALSCAQIMSQGRNP